VWRRETFSEYLCGSLWVLPTAFDAWPRPPSAR
jgi:hypothetical protein